MNNNIMELKNAKKIYKIGKIKEIVALDNVSMSFDEGKFYAIMGHSGSGKSTMISILGLLDDLTSGEYILNGKNVINISELEKANLRKDYLGFIYQEFYLDEHLKAWENVSLPLLINKTINKKDIYNKVIELLDIVGLSDRVNHFPKELSGGEKQRVAIARALANNPKIILADEPTGDLDVENEIKVFELLSALKTQGKCIIVVSHSNEVIKYADKVYYIDHGRLAGNQHE